MVYKVRVVVMRLRQVSQSPVDMRSLSLPAEWSGARYSIDTRHLNKELY